MALLKMLPKLWYNWSRWKSYGCRRRRLRWGWFLFDIYVANDHSMNYLWHNNGGKSFTDVGTPSGTAFGQSGESAVSMSVDFADIPVQEGWICLFQMINTAGYMKIWEMASSQTGHIPRGFAMPAGQYVGWSSSFIDYNNDGLVDIFKANGALKHLYGTGRSVIWKHWKRKI